MRCPEIFSIGKTETHYKHRGTNKGFMIRCLTPPEPSRAGCVAHASLHHLDKLRHPPGGDSGEVVSGHFQLRFFSWLRLELGGGLGPAL